MKGEMVLLQRRTRDGKARGIALSLGFFKQILQLYKSLQMYMFGKAKRCRNCQGNCRSIKNSEFICLRVSMTEEKQQYLNKKGRAVKEACDREVFPRHVLQQRLRTFLCSRRDPCLITALCLSLPGFFVGLSLQCSRSNPHFLSGR